MLNLIAAHAFNEFSFTKDVVIPSSSIIKALEICLVSCSYADKNRSYINKHQHVV